MTEQEQITLYSCRLCGFCETSLSALTRHTSSHIKLERNSEHENEQPEASSNRVSVETNCSDVQLIERQDIHCMSTSATSSMDRLPMIDQPHNGEHRSARQRQDGGSSYVVDDDEVIVLRDNLKSPQIGDVFPASSNPVTTQSRVIFPLGWNEAPQRTTTVRMPNDRYGNVQQTKSVSAQEAPESGQNLPKIINCTTVRSGNMPCDNSMTRDSNYYNRNSYETVRSDSTGYPPASVDRSVTLYRNDMAIDVEGDDPGKTVRPMHQQLGRSQNDFVAIIPRSSPTNQVAYNRKSSARIRDVEIYENNERGQYYHAQRVRPPVQSSNSSHLHPAAFASFNNPANASFQQMSSIRYRNDQQPSVNYSRINRPPYQSHNPRQGNQVKNIQHEPVDAVSRFATYNHIACPVPLPNNGNFIVNHNQQIVLPPFGSPDNVLGMLVIPIKKTCEISIQTDESCLSNDNRPYQATKRKLSSVGVQFSGQQDLTVNEAEIQSNETGSKLANCSVCSKDFPDAAQLRSHFEKCHSRESLKCKDCGQVFQTAKNMQMHKARVHNKRMPFRCGVCGLRFEDRSSVVQHLATHNANEKPASCETCGKKFRSEERLKRHSLKHKDMWHKCTDCGRSFGSVATLDYHTEQMHKRKKETNTTDTDAASINENVQPFSGLQQPTLEVNNSSSEDDNEVKEGEVSNSLNTEHDAFACQHCNMSFKDALELENHVSNCDKSFGNDSSLRMFRCIVCQTFFATKSQLTNHQNSTHLTRDGYVCSKCPRKFRLWSKLKLHIKTFHPLKKLLTNKFACTACISRFSTREKLNDHMKKIHQIPVKHERIYTCKECKKRFRNLSSLMVHRRGVHELNILESPSTQTWECPCCNIERLTRKTYIAHLKEVHNLLVVEKGRSLEIIGKGSSAEGQIETVRSERSHSLDTSLRSINSQNMKEGTTEDQGLQQQESQKFVCQECGANFTEEKRLKNHLGLVHGQKPFSCGICNRKFAYSGQIVWHMRDHGRKEARKKRLKENFDAGSHQNVGFINSQTDAPAIGLNTKVTKTTKPAGEIHSCVHCGTSFPDEKRLNNHLGVRHGYKNFQCDVCNQRFSYSTHLIWHRRSHFSERKKEQTSRVPGLDEFVDVTGSERKVDAGEEIAAPAINDENSSNERRQSNAGDYENGNSGVQLEKGAQPRTGWDAEAEKISEDKLINSSVLPDSRYICGQCDAEFNDKELFQSHMLTSHGVPVDCVNDGKNHVENSPSCGSKVFTCEICNKQLATYIGWKVHRTRVHRVSGDENSANVSSSDVPNSTSYAPPYVDPAASFQDSELMELGSEDLNSPTVYSCSKCSRIFTGLRNLRAHQFKIHSIRSKDKGTKSSVGITSEPGESPLFAKVQDGEIFQCGTCDYQFSSEKGRRIHCKKMTHVEYRESPSSYSSDVKTLSNIDKVSYETRLASSEDGDTGSPMSKRQKFDEDIEDIISPCEICFVEFSSFNELKSHLQEKHPAEMSYETPEVHSGNSVAKQQADKASTPSKSGPPFSNPILIDCPKCDRSFPSRKGVNTHLVKFHRIKGAAFARWMEEERLVQSAKAQGRDRFSYNGSNDTVTSLPENANRLPSDQRCRSESMTGSGRGFTPTMVGLNVNESQHNSGIRRACTICQRSFHNRRGLTMHMARFHHLSKSELRKFNLDLDMIIETEQTSPGVDGAGKPSKVPLKPSGLGEDCPLCDMKFPNRRSLGTHIFKRHGIRCKRLSPAERKSLFSNRNHKTTSVEDSDSDDKPKLVAIECPICPGKFVGKRGVRAHVSRIHGLDKVELGFLFPEKQLTDDAVTAVCKYCNRDFSNARIYAAHIYFVHKKDHLEVNDSKEVALGSVPVAYHCSDLKCEQIFNSALELLVHIREKYNRSIEDTYTDMKVTNDDNSLDHIDDYDYYEDEDDDSFEEDTLDREDLVLIDSETNEDINLKDVEMVNESKFDEGEKSNTINLEFAEEKFACFHCKSEFKDEFSFKIHYKKEHAGIYSDDAEKMRDAIERSRLQSDAVSKEYGLRETASRKAFRSEIVFTEECLKSPSIENDGEKPDAYPKDVSKTAFMKEGEHEANKADDFSLGNASKIYKDGTLNPSTLSGSGTGSHEMENHDDNDARRSVNKNNVNNSEEPSKKNFFAAALNLKVTP